MLLTSPIPVAQPAKILSWSAWSIKYQKEKENDFSKTANLKDNPSIRIADSSKSWVYYESEINAPNQIIIQEYVSKLHQNIFFYFSNWFLAIIIFP